MTGILPALRGSQTLQRILVDSCQGTDEGRGSWAPGGPHSQLPQQAAQMHTHRRKQPGRCSPQSTWPCPQPRELTSQATGTRQCTFFPCDGKGPQNQSNLSDTTFLKLQNKRCAYGRGSKSTLPQNSSPAMICMTQHRGGVAVSGRGREGSRSSLTNVCFVIQVFMSLPPIPTHPEVCRGLRSLGALLTPNQQKVVGTNTRLKHRWRPSAAERRFPTHSSWCALAERAPHQCNHLYACPISAVSYCLFFLVEAVGRQGVVMRPTYTGMGGPSERTEMDSASTYGLPTQSRPNEGTSFTGYCISVPLALSTKEASTLREREWAPPPVHLLPSEGG